MIEINNLTKIYRLGSRQMRKEKVTTSTRVAVSDVSLRAEKGEIFGLLGSNGAGKTTTLRCIATLFLFMQLLYLIKKDNARTVKS